AGRSGSAALCGRGRAHQRGVGRRDRRRRRSAPRGSGRARRISGRGGRGATASARRRRPVKGFGNIMKEAQKLQAQMAAMQEEVAKKKVEATAGGGMVTVEANGKQELTAIKIDPEVVSKDDVQMLEDLVLAACNEALRKSRELVQQELGKLTGGLKIPCLRMSAPLVYSPEAVGPPVRGLFDRVQRPPGIGPKTAQRLTFFLLKRPVAEVRELAESLVGLKDRIGSCGTCFQLTDQDPCRLCADPARDGRLLCVVEEPNDLLAMERTGEYRGRYHVLQGRA